MLLFMVFLLRLPAADSFAFPALCIPSKTGRVPCCPPWNGSPCGQSSGRGSCVNLPASRTVSNPDVVLDERHKFPWFYYSTKCQCNGNYSGVHCGECTFNHYGDKCENVRIIIRPEIRQLTKIQVIKYILQLNYCKKKIDPNYVILTAPDRFRQGSFRFRKASFYDVWCYSHYHATKPFLIDGVERYQINYAHLSSGFLPWHRLFLCILENQMQRCLNNPYFALAYYDWRSDTNCSICTNEYVGSNDARGVISPLSIFSTWRMCCGNHDYDATYCLMPDSDCERTNIRRQAGYVPGVSKPTKAALEYCLTLANMDTPPYTPESRDSFRCCIEGWVDRYNRPTTTNHNLFHVYIGGTMSQVPIACNDPLFALHHALIDKYWEIWFKKWHKNTIYPTNRIYPNNTIYGHQPTDCCCPFFHCWTMQQMSVPLTGFGIQYSNSNDPI